MDIYYPFGGNQEKSGTQELKKVTLKKQVIELLYSKGLTSISTLCEPTQTSIPTMASIVSELIEEDWVRRFGTGESSGGRKPAMYGLNNAYRFIAGVDLSQRYTRMGIFNLNNEPVADLVEISDGLDTSAGILETIKKEMGNLLRKARVNKSHVLGYGLAIPGLIDIQKGISYSYPHFGSRRLATIFGELFEGEAFIEHDTKAMAVGETWFGLAKNKANVLCLSIGSGIGLGIIINGMLYQGHSGFSGEFGHIQMDPGGGLCYCGKIGCLETVASGTTMVRNAINQIHKGQSTSIIHMAGNDTRNIKLATIIGAANAGDPFAIGLIEDAGEHLARGLAMLIHLFNPEMIIIGGELSQTGNLLLHPIQQNLHKYSINRIHQATTIHLSKLGREAVLLGTIPMVMTNIFSMNLYKNKI